MKIKIYSDSLLGQLARLKNHILWLRGCLCVIESFTFVKETTTKTKGFFTKENYEVEEYYITSFKLRGYNSHGKFWGYFDENSLESILIMYDLDVARQNFITLIKEPLESIGVNFEIKKQEKI